LIGIRTPNLGPHNTQIPPVLPVAIERESAVAPSSPTQLKLQLSVDMLDGIPFAIALIPASEMRLPPRARVTRDVEVMVLSATAAAPVSPAAKIVGCLGFVSLRARLVVHA
jgi:hypothetical protein